MVMDIKEIDSFIYLKDKSEKNNSGEDGNMGIYSIHSITFGIFCR
jgi:hypothetical protein